MLKTNLCDVTCAAAVGSVVAAAGGVYLSWAAGNANMVEVGLAVAIHVVKVGISVVSAARF